MARPSSSVFASFSQTGWLQIGQTGTRLADSSCICRSLTTGQGKRTVNDRNTKLRARGCQSDNVPAQLPSLLSFFGPRFFAGRRIYEIADTTGGTDPSLVARFGMTRVSDGVGGCADEWNAREFAAVGVELRKERKNAAHGASRGATPQTSPSPGGAKEINSRCIVHHRQRYSS